MAYVSIAKLEKFTSKEDDAQVWLNNIEKAIAANGWNDTRAMQAIPYFFQDTADLWDQSLWSCSEKKPLMAMYTDAKVDGHSIKLILDSGSVGSIITKQLIDQLGCQVDRVVSAKIITTDGATKTPIGEINNFFIEVNGIIVPIKVLVMEATQYQSTHWK
ncbi:hypothetical protein G9A89_007640 [Geosiphon pyriformis]|nr:hypothetical protein G9A89_007640 [Geosiphon pyriformis]